MVSQNAQTGLSRRKADTAVFWGGVMAAAVAEISNEKS